jgi:hypothetical protein
MYGGRGRGRGGPGEGEGPMQPHRLRRVAGGPTVHRSTSDEWSAGVTPLEGAPTATQRPTRAPLAKYGS